MKYQNESIVDGQDSQSVVITEQQKAYQRQAIEMLPRIEQAILNNGSVWCLYSDDNSLNETAFFIQSEKGMSNDRLYENLVQLLNEIPDDSIKEYDEIVTLAYSAMQVIKAKREFKSALMEADIHAHKREFVGCSQMFIETTMNAFNNLPIDQKLKEDLRFLLDISFSQLTVLYDWVLTKRVSINDNGKYVNALINALISLDFLKMEESGEPKLTKMKVL